MQMLGFIPFLCWLPLIHAQYEESPTTPRTTSTSTSAAGAIQTVDVGEDGLVFHPDTLTVSPGGKVEFHFYPGNHSVAQAAFARPCHPLSESSIFSGFIPATGGESSEVFTLTINDTNPIWYYCGQVGHCQAGMVGVINPPNNSQDTLAAFKAAASDAVGITVPATVNGGVLGKPSAESTTPTTTTTTTTTHSSPSPSPTQTGDGSTTHVWKSLSIVLVLSYLVAIYIM